MIYKGTNSNLFFFFSFETFFLWLPTLSLSLLSRPPPPPAGIVGMCSVPAVAIRRSRCQASSCSSPVVCVGRVSATWRFPHQLWRWSWTNPSRPAPTDPRPASNRLHTDNCWGPTGRDVEAPETALWGWSRFFPTRKGIMYIWNDVERTESRPGRRGGLALSVGVCKELFAEAGYDWELVFICDETYPVPAA